MNAAPGRGTMSGATGSSPPVAAPPVVPDVPRPNSPSTVRTEYATVSTLPVTTSTSAAAPTAPTPGSSSASRPLLLGHEPERRRDGGHGCGRGRGEGAQHREATSQAPEPAHVTGAGLVVHHADDQEQRRLEQRVRGEQRHAGVGQRRGAHPDQHHERPSWLTVPWASASLASCWRRACTPPTRSEAPPQATTSEPPRRLVGEGRGEAGDQHDAGLHHGRRVQVGATPEWGRPWPRAARSGRGTGPTWRRRRPGPAPGPTVVTVPPRGVGDQRPTSTVVPDAGPAGSGRPGGPGRRHRSPGRPVWRRCGPRRRSSIPISRNEVMEVSSQNRNRVKNPSERTSPTWRRRTPRADRRCGRGRHGRVPVVGAK